MDYIIIIKDWLIKELTCPCTINTIVYLSAFIGVVLLLNHWLSPSKLVLEDKYAIISGGSKGIGRQLAIDIVKKGGSVTIIARSEEELSRAAVALERYKIKESQSISVLSADLCISTQDQVDALAAQLRDVIADNGGRVDVLVNCAGTSVIKPFEALDMSDWSFLTHLNVFGGVALTQVCLPYMKQDASPKRIVFVSSQAGQLGVYGYAAYSSTKFALRGVAEVLQQEVRPFNIHVSVAFPPDTDTPGYQEEQKHKPKVTQMISEYGGLYSVEQVSRDVISGVETGRHLISTGLDGHLLAMGCAGAAPVNRLATVLLADMWLAGVIRAVFVVYQYIFDRIVKKQTFESAKTK